MNRNYTVLLGEQLRKHLNIYSLFGSVFLFHILFVFQGFDVTDSGFHMTNHVLSFTTSPDPSTVAFPIFLTDFIGGMWFSIIGSPSVLWARLGGVLLIALNASIVYSILKHYFAKEKVFVVVFVSTLLITMRSGDYINYFTFPALLINIELLVFNKILLLDRWSKKGSFYGILLGFMVVPIVLSRIPLLLIGIVPVLIVMYMYWYKIDDEILKKSVSPAFVGLFLSLICFGTFYYYLGILDDYFANTVGTIFASAMGDTQKVDSSHTMFNLFGRYVLDYVYVIVGTMVIFTGLYITSLVKERLGMDKVNILVIFSTVTVLFLILLSGLSVDFFAINGLKVTIGVILLLLLLYVKFSTGRNRNLDLLIIGSAIVMIINPVGSNTGIYKSLYGMWLILPLILLISFQMKDSINNIRLKSMYSLLSVVLVCLLIVSMFFHFTCVYRDDSNRLNLNTEFSDPTLHGIHSTPERVEVVDELLSQIRIYSDPGDEVLMVNGIPMFYYLTETKPALGNSWLFLEPLDEIKHNQNKLENTGNLPQLFIYSKTNSFDENWPATNSNGIDKYQDKLDYCKQRYIGSLNYTLIWENNAFCIYLNDSHTSTGDS